MTEAMSMQQKRESATATQNLGFDRDPAGAGDLLTVQEFAALARVTQRTVRGLGGAPRRPRTDPPSRSPDRALRPRTVPSMA